jgi:hypothetical protein
VKAGAVSMSQIMAHPTHRMDAEYWLSSESERQRMDMDNGGPRPDHFWHYDQAMAALSGDQAMAACAHMLGAIYRLLQERR